MASDVANLLSVSVSSPCAQKAKQPMAKASCNVTCHGLKVKLDEVQTSCFTSACRLTDHGCKN